MTNNNTKTGFFAVGNNLGEITSCGNCLYDPSEEGLIELTYKVSRNTHYITKEKEVLERPKSPCTVEGSSIVNIPIGATIVVDGEVVVESASSDTILFAKDSTSVQEFFTVVVSNWPELDFEVTL